MTRRGTPYQRGALRSSGEPWCDTLRDERLARRMTQAAVAEACCVEKSTITGWERGVNVKNMTKWRRWADKLGFEIVMRRKGDGDVAG